MQIRYTGPLAAVDLAVPGCLVRFERDEWVDIEEALDDANVPRFHAAIVARGLVDSPEWEVDGDFVDAPKPRKPRSPRKPQEPPAEPEQSPDPAEPPAEPPAVPGEEQS